MVIKRYIRGIAFVVLMLSIISVAAGVSPGILSSSPPTPINDTAPATKTFNVAVDQIANFTWFLDSVQVQLNNENLNIANYTNTTSSIGVHNVTVIADNPNGTVMQKWDWNVTAVAIAPSIISWSNNYTNNNSLSLTVGNQTVVNFNVTSDQIVNYIWYYDGTDQSTNYDNFTKQFLSLGSHTITANVTNSNGSATKSWSVTVSDLTSPASITNLVMENNGTSWIKWNWTNPIDTDFAKVMVYIDGIFKDYVTSPTANYNVTNLSSGYYTISTHTVDTSGNINSTWVNLTNYTTPNTAVGTNRNVSLSNSISLLFSNVDIAGNSFALVDVSPPATSGFASAGSFYNITTTANYTGLITVTIPYNAGVDRNYVRLFHYEGSAWKDVTTGSDATTVTGQVTSLSPFVPGVFPGPVITSPSSPSPATVQTIGIVSQNFTVTFNQTVNVTWYINGTNVSSNTSVTSNYYLNNSPVTGTWNITVVGSNANGTASYKWLWTVRPRTYETGNRIWDSTKEMNLTYTWNPMSFYAFYYDVDNNVGNESLKIILDSNTDRNIQENSLIYSTAPDNVSFKYKKWGYYNVIGFMAEKYFAAYTAGSTGITSTPTSPIGTKQLHKILMDDDTSRAVYAGSTLTLSEGYVLKIKDVDITGGKIVLLSLLKDGGEVDTTAVQAGSTYVYSKKVGSVSELPIIAVHIDTVFSGREANAAFLKGIFQISESFTSVSQGNRYGIMEITGASDTGITMVNKNSISLSPNSVNDVMGDIKIIVADNSSVLRFAPMVQKSGTYEVRGTIAQSTDTTNFDWNPLNFEGFYYDINEDVGSEKLIFTRSDRSIGENNLIYTTTPQSVSFKYKKFGSFNVIGFMAEKYFAGYTTNSTGITSTAISTISSKQLHKVLADDDTQRAVYAGSTLTLNEGYVLKVKDVDITGGKIVLIQLLKDGGEVDTTAIEAGKTYIYTKRVGSVSDLPIIAVHIETVFSGREANAAFLKGIFQLSESYTTVNTGDQFGAMKVSEVSDTKIEMKNPSTVSLNTANTIDVMGKIKFHVADSGDVRFYPFIMVNGSIASANQLSIDAPAAPSVKDIITITVTAGGTPVSGASVSFDNNDIGTTNSTGRLDYTLTRSGMHNITATKLGYEKATKTIQVSEWVDNRLSIEVPAIIDQGVQVSIKVTSNGSAVAGASVTFDNSAVGTTNIGGILNYTFNVGGTHNLGASKDKYVSVVREINIRLPFSEYKALDIGIVPGSVFTNEKAVIRSNITNAGTKADTKPVELILNGTVVDNRSVALAPGEIKEINFTRQEALPGNYTVEILGQKGLLEVKEEPLNLLLIGGIATGFGVIIIYLLTAKSKISLELLRQKLMGKSATKGVEEIRKVEEINK